MEIKSIKDKTIQVIECVLIGYYVFILIDEATDGKASKELNSRAAKVKTEVKRVYDNRREYRKQLGHVIFDAITTVEDTSRATEDNGSD